VVKYNKKKVSSIYLQYIKNFRFYIFFALITITGCEKNKFDIKLKKEIDITVYRTDSILFTPPVDSVIKYIDVFYESYPDFADIYFTNVLSIGGRDSRYFTDYLKLFLSNPDFRECYDSVKLIFNSFDKKKNEIENAFNYLRYYLPDIQIPEIYTMISGFNEPIIILNDAVGISLDKFLGTNSIFYQKLQGHRYLHKRYNPDLISVEVVRSWIEYEYPNLDSIYNLANVMIYYGKIMYLMDAAFPKQPDYFKISYLPIEITWAKNSEKHIWAYFIDKKLLFTTNEKEISRFINEVPYIQDFGTDSPGRVGIWMGWQIVRNYMNKNPEITIRELIENNDHQTILLQSGYAPR